MRMILLTTACAALAACVQVGDQAPVKTAQTQAKVTQVSAPGNSACYTVVLFDKIKVQKPPPKTPEVYSQFLGKWVGGAWNGFWCHDLLVYKVTKDGRAEVYEMHAPYAPWNEPATAFKREAKIDGDGRLHYLDGVDRLSYRIVGGQMQATRSGVHGVMKTTLRNAALPMIPVPRPVLVVQAGSTQTPGT